MKTTTANFSQLRNPKDAAISGRNLDAHTTKLLQPENNEIEEIYKNLFNRPVVKLLPVPVQVIIELQLLYGLRITEVLSIGATDIMRNGLIHVRGKKGSQDRYIYSQRFSNYVMFCKVNNVAYLCDYSRFYFYRLYKKLGIYYKFAGNDKNSVTHFFRHSILNAQKLEGMETEDSQRFIGHKSIKSTKIYRNGKRG